jgi:tetratricopeptide (TPR) repeat protein
MLTTFLVLFYTDIEALKSHLNWFAATALPGEGMYRQAEMVFDYMNDHPELLTPETRLQHGALLMQMGKQPKAKEVLELALAEQGGIKKDRPENTTAYRVAGQALTLLGRRGEAQVEFRHALEMDRARLERLTGTEAEAKIRWSLGRTLLAGGEDAAALEQLSIAGAVARDRRTKKQIKEYIEENFGKDALVP